MAALIIGAIAAVASAVVGGIVSYNASKETNAANKEIAAETNQTQVDIANSTNQQQMDMFNEQMDWTRYVQEQEWQRADTANQRAVADAKAAGLSPLAVLGGSQTGSIAAQPSAPHLSVPQMALAQMSPWDASSFLNLSDLSRSLFDVYKNDKTLKSDEKVEKMKQLEEDERFFSQLNQVSSITQQQLAADESKFSRQLSENIRQFDSNLEFLRGESDRNYVLKEMDSMSSLAMDITGQSSGAYNKVKDFNEWQTSFRKWSDDYAAEAEKITAEYQSHSVSHGESSGSSKGSAGNAGISAGAFGVSGSINAGGSRSSGESSSISDSETRTESFSEYWKHRMASWFAKNPIPIYSAY